MSESSTSTTTGSSSPSDTGQRKVRVVLTARLLAEFEYTDGNHAFILSNEEIRRSAVEEFRAFLADEWLDDDDDFRTEILSVEATAETIS